MSWAPDEAPSRLAERGPWDVLLVSGRDVREPRACWCREHFPDLKRICLSRAGADTHNRFHVGEAGKTSLPIGDEVDWTELPDWLRQHLPAGSRVLVDMNLLELDTLLYVVPALRQLQLTGLACLYVAPEDYTFPERALTDQRLHPIEQPKGYASLALDPDRQGARHLVFLGFDMARAWKFVDRYDWKEEHLYVVIGDPPFVADGIKRAREAAEPWLSEFERAYPDHVQRVSATDPAAVAAFCADHFAKSNWLDLAPLGPKPMNLGILWFYFGRTAKEQEKVRLLYDFPVQHAPRSKGVARVHYYDCRRVLRP